MFQEAIGKGTKAIAKQGPLIIVATVCAAVAVVYGEIRYQMGRKKGHKEGCEETARTFKGEFDKITAMFK